MPVNTTSTDEARAAWATASRDTKLDRWHDLYDVAMPQTSHTTRERYIAGYPPRDLDESARYRELDAATRPGAEIEARQ
jgi:hypothetical protein